MTLLSVEALRVALPDGRAVVNDLSFRIEAGRFLALVGESGSGKTMAARAILRLLAPPLRITSGRIVFEGSDLVPLPEHDLRRLRGPAIGMVFQEPMVSLNPAMRIGAQMTEALVIHQNLDRAAATRAARAMLDRVRIDPDRAMGAYPHEFSGGMRQRIMLASVMLLRPRLLLADEPTTALDTLAQREVLDLMVGLARDQGTAVLLITHNLGLVGRYADDAVVLREGRMVECGTARGILADPVEAYTRALVDALPQRLARPAVPDAAPVIAVRDLHVTFPGRARLFGPRATPVAAVRGVSLQIRPGETVAVVGGSGSGKTTLGRAILGLAPVTSGQVLFQGVAVDWRDAVSRRAFRMACQLVFQDPYSSLDPRFTVAATVEEPLRLVPGLSAEQRHARTQAMLEEVGLGGMGGRLPHALSGGQRQRVAIARALVRDPVLVVADEAVSALDMTIQKQILGLLERLQRARGFACLFITHDLSVVEQIADRVVVMENGMVVEHGPRDTLLDAPRHPYTRALLDAAPRLVATDA